MKKLNFFLFLFVLLLIPKISLGAYGSNVITGGTASADSYTGGYEPSKATDNNLTTRWASGNIAYPHYWEYDLGIGNEKKLSKISFNTVVGCANTESKDFSLTGSNDNFSSSSTLTRGTISDLSDKTLQEFTFSNTTNYRYYRIDIINTFDFGGCDNYASFWEIQGFETLTTSGDIFPVDNGTTTYYTTLMSQQTDFMVQLMIESYFVILGLVAGYLFLKRITKK